MVNLKQPVVSSIEVEIPGRKTKLRIVHVVFDFNGTLARDGRLLNGVGTRVRKLARVVDVTVLTADTFGTVARTMKGLPTNIGIVKNGTEKLKFIRALGPGSVTAIGNGVNDIPMLRAAALGIAVIGDEGAAGELLSVATVVVRNINDALDLLLKPKRLVATLRK
ncbi:MAG TPA: HAD hydrolase family protein [candidate division Zixibacteria bacterium]|nr:HAD hydrolase family protein [candidate division Zixibacteria bacterium]